MTLYTLLTSLSDEDGVFLILQTEYKHGPSFLHRGAVGIQGVLSFLTQGPMLLGWTTLVIQCGSYALAAWAH